MAGVQELTFSEREETLRGKWAEIKKQEELLDPESFSKLKDEWFFDAFNLLKELPKSNHCWCSHAEIVYPLLEPFYHYDSTSEANEDLFGLWTRISKDLDKCADCIFRHHNAQKSYREEFEDNEITDHLLKNIHRLDCERVSGNLKKLGQNISKKNVSENDKVTLHCIILEILMFPILLEDLAVSTYAAGVLRYFSENFEFSLAEGARYPGLYWLLFHEDKNVRLVAFNLAKKQENFHDASDLTVIDSLIASVMESLENGVFAESKPSLNGIQNFCIKSTVDLPAVVVEGGARKTVCRTREEVWLGLQTILGLLDPPALERGIFEKYATFTGVILNQINEDSSVFRNVLNVLKLLLENLGCKLWLNSDYSEYIPLVRSSIIGQCFRSKKEPIQKSLLDVISPFLQSLEALFSGEYERQRRRFLYFLLIQIPFSPSFSKTISKIASQIAFNIVNRGFSLQPPLPAMDCVNIWAPLLLPTILDPSAPPQIRKPAIESLQAAIVSDTAVVIQLMTKLKRQKLTLEEKKNSLSEICYFSPSEENTMNVVEIGSESTNRWRDLESIAEVARGECENWQCAPGIWRDLFHSSTLTEKNVSGDIVDLAIWVLSRLQFVSESLSEDENLERFETIKWSKCKGFDDVHDDEFCPDSVRLESKLFEICFFFRRCVTSFFNRIENCPVSINPWFGGSLFLLLISDSGKISSFVRKALSLSPTSNPVDKIVGMTMTEKSRNPFFSAIRDIACILSFDTTKQNFVSMENLIRKLWDFFQRFWKSSLVNCNETEVTDFLSSFSEAFCGLVDWILTQGLTHVDENERERSFRNLFSLLLLISRPSEKKSSVFIAPWMKSLLNFFLNWKAVFVSCPDLKQPWKSCVFSSLAGFRPAKQEIPAAVRKTLAMISEFSEGTFFSDEEKSVLFKHLNNDIDVLERSESFVNVSESRHAMNETGTSLLKESENNESTSIVEPDVKTDFTQSKSAFAHFEQAKSAFDWRKSVMDQNKIIQSQTSTSFDQFNETKRAFGRVGKSADSKLAASFQSKNLEGILTGEKTKKVKSDDPFSLAFGSVGSNLSQARSALVDQPKKGSTKLAVGKEAPKPSIHQLRREVESVFTDSDRSQSRQKSDAPVTQKPRVKAEAIRSKADLSSNSSVAAKSIAIKLDGVKENSLLNHSKSATFIDKANQREILGQVFSVQPKRQIITLDFPPGKPGLKAVEKGSSGATSKPQIQVPIPKIDDWLKMILSLDLLQILRGEFSLDGGESMSKVPIRFSTWMEYCKVFRPFLVEEMAAQLGQLAATGATGLKPSVVRLVSMEMIDSFWVGRFIEDENAESAKNGGRIDSEEGFRACMEGDLIFLSKKEVQDDFSDENGNFHVIAKVDRKERSQGNKSPTVHLRFYLPDTNRRLSSVRYGLKDRSKWLLKKLLSFNPLFREAHALVKSFFLPGLPEILGSEKQKGSFPDPEKLMKNLLRMPENFVSRIRKDLNFAQLGAVGAAVGSAKEKKSIYGHTITLIQGPPGTGKTKTIIAMISAILAQNSKTRILVCAQSNSAVDEIVKRLSNKAAINIDGVQFCPRMVRVGAGGKQSDNAFNKAGRDDVKKGGTEVATLEKSCQSCVQEVHIDFLVDQELKGGNNGEKQEVMGTDVSVLRKKLDDKIKEIRAFEEGSGGGLEAIEKDKKKRLDFLYDEKRAIGRKLAESERERKQKFESDRELKAEVRRRIIRESQVVLTTLSGSGGEILDICHGKVGERRGVNVGKAGGKTEKEGWFDVVIIDEAGQAVETATLIPFQTLNLESSRCIMVGDPKQLPATVLCRKATKLGYDRSLFERLQKIGHPVIMLNVQYRMHPEISLFPSKQFYEGRLRDGFEADSGLREASFHGNPNFKPFLFYDVEDGREHVRAGNNPSFFNLNEAEMAVEIVKSLRNSYPNEVKPGRIGVISPYKQQISVLRDHFDRYFGAKFTSGVEFNTVDGYQGREVDILIFSAVRASVREAKGAMDDKMRTNVIGFVSDIRRMNVGLTRAKYSLWVLGHEKTLRLSPPWEALIRNSKERNAMIVARKPYRNVFGAGAQPSMDRESREIAATYHAQAETRQKGFEENVGGGKSHGKRVKDGLGEEESHGKKRRDADVGHEDGHGQWRSGAPVEKAKKKRVKVKRDGALKD